ncbi:guanylate kinase-related [Holotrichia oblita]|nr:guanylate kinase-related [Holotrichia oblita]
MNKPGMLIVISGPSGTGKGTIAKILAEDSDFELSVSRTTRAPRPGEIDGKHYYFTTVGEFEKLIEENGFFEYALYNGNYYGTPVENVEQKLLSGKNVILEIEVKGALKIKDVYKNDYISIFIIPPSKEEMEKRLRERGSDSEEDIKKRLEISSAEIEMAHNYEYLVVNDTVENAVSDIKKIVAVEGLKTKRNDNAILKFKGEVK